MATKSNATRVMQPGYASSWKETHKKPGRRKYAESIQPATLAGSVEYLRRGDTEGRQTTGFAGL